MAFLFGRNRQRSNNDLARITKDLLQRLETCTDDKQLPRIEDDLNKTLAQMKVILQGSQGMHLINLVARNDNVELEVNAQQAAQLVQQLIHDNVLLPLAQNLHRLSFEARKDAQATFSAVFRHGNEGAEPAVLSHVFHNSPELVVALCNGYNHGESARVSGQILREALKFDTVAALILYHEPSADGRAPKPIPMEPTKPCSGKGVFWKFFDWIEKSAFDLSADAFSTFEVRSSAMVNSKALIS